MAKNTKSDYPFPSRFGSHASMIDEVATVALGDQSFYVGGPLVVIKDEFGTYTTERNRLDNRCADPNRYAFGRLQNRLPKEKPTAAK